MNKPRFKIAKTSYYTDGEKEYEEYDIYGYSKILCSADRKDIEELYEQLTIALNDHKEIDNEKTAK